MKPANNHCDKHYKNYGEDYLILNTQKSRNIILNNTHLINHIEINLKVKRRRNSKYKQVLK